MYTRPNQVGEVAQQGCSFLSPATGERGDRVGDHRALVYLRSDPRLPPFQTAAPSLGGEGRRSGREVLCTVARCSYSVGLSGPTPWFFVRGMVTAATFSVSRGAGVVDSTASSRIRWATTLFPPRLRRGAGGGVFSSVDLAGRTGVPGLGRQGGGGDQANGFLSFGSAPALAVLPTPSEDPVGCTGLFLLVLPVLVAAATAGERRGGPALGWWWLVAAALPILLRLRRTEEPELGPRCTGMILGRRATAATPRRSRRGSSSTHKAVSGDGVSSVKGLADTCIFLWHLSRRRRRSTAGDDFICGLHSS